MTAYRDDRQGRRGSPQLRTAHGTPSFSYSVGTAQQPPWNSQALTHPEVPDLRCCRRKCHGGKRSSFPLQSHVLETPKPGSGSPGSPGCLWQGKGARRHKQLPAVSRLLSQRPRMKKQGPVSSEAISVWPSLRMLLQGTQWHQSLGVTL